MHNTEKLKKLVSWMKAKNMADSTIETYSSFIIKFFKEVDKDSIRVSADDVQKFILNIPEHYSNSYRNQAINAIRLYFIIIEGRYFKKIVLPRPKRDKFIPNVLTPDQIRAVIFNTKNIKHQAILFTIYDNGLRISELQNLTWQDLQSKANTPHLIIRNAKHHSSRTIPISEQYIKVIKRYYIWQSRSMGIIYDTTTSNNNKNGYIFKGESGGKYSSTSIRNILREALKREGIKTPFRVHDLRHSFATHCLAQETDIHHLSKILGHKSVKTTESTYAHLQFNQLQIHRIAI